MVQSLLAATGIFVSNITGERHTYTRISPWIANCHLSFDLIKIELNFLASNLPTFPHSLPFSTNCNSRTWTSAILDSSFSTEIDAQKYVGPVFELLHHPLTSPKNIFCLGYSHNLLNTSPSSSLPPSPFFWATLVHSQRKRQSLDSGWPHPTWSEVWHHGRLFSQHTWPPFSSSNMLTNFHLRAFLPGKLSA